MGAVAGRSEMGGGCLRCKQPGSPALRTVCTPSPVGRALYACPVHPVASGHAWNARPTDPVSKQETAHLCVRAKEKGLPFGSPLCWHYLFSRPGQAIVAPSATVRGTVAGACCLPELRKRTSFRKSFVLALPIFTARRQATIVGVSELNFCVRDGNRCFTFIIATDK